MSGSDEITYALDFRARRLRQTDHELCSDSQQLNREPSGGCIPRIARLMALAIRFHSLLRAEEFRDYTELARLGRVTRPRMTQIIRLLDLASCSDGRGSAFPEHC